MDKRTHPHIMKRPTLAIPMYIMRAISISESGILKLCDFGSAKHLVRGEPNVSYICSRYYRAPELIFGATDYTTNIDVWSAGKLRVVKHMNTSGWLGYSNPTFQQFSETSSAWQQHSFDTTSCKLSKRFLAFCNLKPNEAIMYWRQISSY